MPKSKKKASVVLEVESFLLLTCPTNVIMNFDLSSFKKQFWIDLLFAF